ESQPHDTLAGQLLDVPLKPTDAFRVPGDSYAFPNKRLAWETIPPLLARGSPLRTSHMRDPAMIHFGSESFIDEVAAALIINPDGLKRAIEGNVVQGASRTLWEEVKFDPKNVTSIDWLTYPILDITETPETIDLVLLNRPEIVPAGAGETAMRPLPAAIA